MGQFARGIGIAAGLLVLLLGAGCAFEVGTGAAIELDQPAFSDDRTRVEVVTTKIGEKNIFIPSTIVLTAGESRTLSFFNTTDAPHGMKIPALEIEVVLPPGEEFVVELPTLEGGKIHQIQCHLHPPHRGAALVVLPSE